MKPRVVCIVQARMGSSRLPGKVMMTLGRRSVLAQVVTRLQNCVTVDHVVIAATDKPTDDPLQAEAEALAVSCFRGSEEDVLQRYHLAAREWQANVVVRITSDCPLIDPQVVDAAVSRYMDGLAESPPLAFVSNTLQRSYPRGLDVEVFSFAALNSAASEATENYQREHVTPFIWQQPERFPQAQIVAGHDWSEYRWTLDTDEDWQLLSTVFQRLDRDGNAITTRDVIELLEADSELAAINTLVQQKALDH